jgi:hypothetical protein
VNLIALPQLKVSYLKFAVGLGPVKGNTGPIAVSEQPFAENAIN